MLNFRKVAASAEREETRQDISEEKEVRGSMERCVEEIDQLSSEFGHPTRRRKPDLPVQASRPAGEADVRARLDMVRRYAQSESAAPEEPPAAGDDPNAMTLAVGSAIRLKGSVEACGVLQVDGHMEATAQSRSLTVAESGKFVGEASVDEADIRGRFEGELTVRGRLVIRSTGSVSGIVIYGSIEIESGGHISGSVEDLPPEGTRDRPRHEDVPVGDEEAEPASGHRSHQPDPSACWPDPSQTAAEGDELGIPEYDD